MALNTLFSPFVSRPAKRANKRQSNLIDWDAPTLPVLEKQRIVYEEQIKDLKEEHEVEDLIREQIMTVTYESYVNELKQTHEKEINEYEEKLNAKSQKFTLLMSQLKQQETTINQLRQENDNLYSQVTKKQKEPDESSVNIKRQVAFLKTYRKRAETLRNNVIDNIEELMGADSSLDPQKLVDFISELKQQFEDFENQI